jgi:hypothetical protein
MPQNTYEDESGLAAGIYEDVYLISSHSHVGPIGHHHLLPPLILSPPVSLLPLAPPLSFSPTRPTSEPGGAVEGNGGWTSDAGPPPSAAPTEPERGRGGQARPCTPQDQIRHGACRGRAATSTTSQVLASYAPPRALPTPALDAASCRSSWPPSLGATSPRNIAPRPTLGAAPPVDHYASAASPETGGARRPKPASRPPTPEAPPAARTLPHPLTPGQGAGEPPTQGPLGRAPGRHPLLPVAPSPSGEVASRPPAPTRPHPPRCY